MSASNPPDIVIGRLPLYLRALTEMAAEGMNISSSQELGNRLGISSAQIRKDLSQFGEFGKQGTGYDIHYLMEQLQRILKVDRVWQVALVGVGDLGRAVMHYAGFIHRGFQIELAFDNDPQKIGQKIGAFTIHDSSEMIPMIRERGVKVAMITVPAADAQNVTDQLVEAGVEAILCYAPTSVSAPKNVRLSYIDPVLHLQHMTHYL